MNALLDLYNIKKFIKLDSQLLFDEKLFLNLPTKKIVNKNYSNIIILLTYNLLFKKTKYYELNDTEKHKIT